MFCCKDQVGNTAVAGVGNENEGGFCFFKIREIIASFYATDSDSIEKIYAREGRIVGLVSLRRQERMGPKTFRWGIAFD